MNDIVSDYRINMDKKSVTAAAAILEIAKGLSYQQFCEAVDIALSDAKTQLVLCEKTPISS